MRSSILLYRYWSAVLLIRGRFHSPPARCGQETEYSTHRSTVRQRKLSKSDVFPVCSSGPGKACADFDVGIDDRIAECMLDIQVRTDHLPTSTCRQRGPTTCRVIADHSSAVHAENHVSPIHRRLRITCRPFTDDWLPPDHSST